MSRLNVNRRKFLAGSATVAAGGLLAAETALPADVDPDSRQASGLKIGEVTDTTAIVWTRLTKHATRNNSGDVIVGKVNKKSPVKRADDPDQLQAACPGAAGRIRVRYGLQDDFAGAKATPWSEVDAKTDFSAQIKLTELEPATKYYVSIETVGLDGSTMHAPVSAQFETAPRRDDPTDVTFCVTTCLAYSDRDHDDGFNIFPAMQRLAPKFVVFTGDSVYYDSEEPKAVTPEIARYHWQRMYSLPRHVELLRSTATYWEKDDHDTHDNDSWPGYRPMGKFTFDEGTKIYRQQVPIEEPIYRTYRWGKDLQIWLTEGRDFRSPNNMPDGPDKTIWGAEQKAWLKRTLLESDAKWRVLVSPTPIVGPDRKNKHDNHSNIAFQHEGDEFRHWVKENVAGNFFVACGDRHWQYYSVHPETGLQEFACGAASDEHAGGTPGFDERYHKFHRVKGGFLSIHVADGRITVRHHDVHGEVVNEWVGT
ncbi:MAG TPA: alkaline phosphatase D family protein [Pirellulales bacterium]|nr:alkaline phosphatase D family protein [Pirellulales bacterium]